MIDEKTNFENLRCEYSQVNQNYRHFETLRLAAFCFHFVVILGTLLFTVGILSGGWWSGPGRVTWSRVLGFFFTSAFLGFDIYCELSLQNLQKVLKTLEESLGFQQFRLLTSPQIIWLRYVTSGLYAVFLIFWLVFK